MNFPQATPKTAILAGPTATGKSGLAIRFASRAEGSKIEIINADSMLVYRGMNIGTAKPTLEEQNGIPHHLIDVRDPDQPFTAGDFFRATHETLQQIHSRGNRALIVGGTGFYLKALLYGLWEAPEADPQLRKTLEELPDSELYLRLETRDSVTALRIGPNDRYRLIRALEMISLTGKTVTELQRSANTTADPQFELLIIDRLNEELFERISLRTRQMLDQGLIEEVKALEEKYPGARSLSAVGYAQVRDFLAGRKPKGRKVREGIVGLRQEIELATRQLVKRQRTWFRGAFKSENANRFARLFLLDDEEKALWRHLENLY